MKPKALVALLVLLSIPMLHAQSMSQSIWNVPLTGGEAIAEPSPEAVAMRRYQDYPVSYASGTADISIPLFDLPARGATVSLGLSYHTGAIKRDDKSTMVGLGWSLTGLGVISRQIKGYPDEWIGIDNQTGKSDDRYAVTFKLDPNSLDWRYLLKIYEGWHDTDYDIFSYSVPGYSGNFIVLCDTISKYPECIVRKIKPIPATTEVHFDLTFTSTALGGEYKFYITTPQGIRYEFTTAETVTTSVNVSPARLQEFANPGYEAQSVWHPTLIIDNKTSDYVSISYTNGGSWQNGELHKCTAQGYTVYFDNYDGQYHTRYKSSDNVVSINSVSSCHNWLIPAKISGKSGSIVCTANSDSNNHNKYIKSIKLLNTDGETIKEAIFDNELTHDGVRRRLDGISIVCDNQVIDKYTFTYNPAIKGAGKDIFGYCNNDSYESVSVLDLSLNWTGRKPDFYGIQSASLKSITDISGVSTSIEYEPSTLNFRSGHQIFGSSIDIGMRIKSITTKCQSTGRWRKRTFKYEIPVCNMDLSQLDYGDFLTQNGTHEIVRLDGIFKYSFGVTHTSSATTRGSTLENAKIYYGRVTEDIIGNDIQNSIRTIYEYALDQVKVPFMNAARTGTCLNAQSTRNDRFQSIYTQYYSNDMAGFDSRALNFHYSRGYFQERFGVSPLLVSRTDYEFVNNIYLPYIEQRYYYSEVDKEIFYNGGFCESTTMRHLRFGEELELNIDCIGDMNFYFTTLYSSRYINDSIITTHFYKDGNKRKIKNENFYKGNQLYSCPGFEFDTNRLTPSTVAYTPLGTRTSCGDESITNYNITAWFSNKTQLRDAAYDRYTKFQPEVEKWVLKTAEGSDSLHRRYDYRYSRNYMILLDKVTVEAGGPANGDTVIISRQKYTDYNNRGRITEMVNAQGRRISAKWMDNYDLLTEMTLPDVGLTTTYTYQPLVGCTSIMAPSGRKRSFSYSADRLVEERNTAGEPVASYSYQLYGDGSSATAANRFSTTIHDSQGSATDVIYYDGFGLPVQTVATVAGNNLVRSSVTYDALDRPVRQYLPVPADDASYNRNIQAAGQMHYDDTCPYAETQYRNMAGDAPLQVIGEGERMQGHPEKYEYLCNNTTDAMLRCRRYRLAGSADSESITLDGDYPAGALDVTRVTDPDGCTLLTFTDWRGLRILERRLVSDSRFADTYYLYDVLGNVRVILQPEGAAQMTSTTKTWTPTDDVIDRYAFINRYDRRGNLTYAKVPGAGPVEMRYDPLNRLAMRRTPDLREYWNEYECFFYDPINRPLFTCVTVADRWGGSGESVDPAEMWNDVPLMTATFATDVLSDDEMFWSSIYSFDDPRAEQLAYTSDMRSQNFYDDYRFINTFSHVSSYFIPDTVSFNERYGKGHLTAAIRRKHGYIRTDYTSNLTTDKPSFPDLYAVYGYDIEGRQTLSCSTTPLPDVFSTTTNTYSRQGYMTSSVENTGSYRLKNDSQYDAVGNILNTCITATCYQFATTTSQTFTYNDLGQLSATICGKNHMLNNAYSYNIRGQITGITSPVFSQTLKYEDGTTPCYNGNISEMTVAYNGGTAIKREFTYDRLNRLIGQTSSDGYNTAYSYNLNSSPLTVMRRGLTSDGTIGTVDDITMTYNGNRLMSVDEAAENVILENSLDYNNATTFTGLGTIGSISYSYDTSGRLKSDPSQAITSITYHANDRPAVIKTQSNGTCSYEYDNDGNKLSVKTTPQSISFPGLGGISQFTRHAYCGSCEFNYTLINKRRNSTLTRINLPWGYIDANGKEYRYISDYQGNIRAVVDSTGTTVQTTDYYPYGLPMATSTGAAANPYKYSGKEFETGSGLSQYDFAARHYRAALPLFNRPDDLAIIQCQNSPYTYCSANPINRSDITGLTDLFDPFGRQHHYVNDGINQVIEVSTEEFLELSKTGFNTDTQLYKSIISDIKRIVPNLFYTIEDVLNGSSFIGWNHKSSGKNCYTKASMQNNAATVGPSQKIDTYSPETSDAKLGATIITQELGRGNSVIVGVQTAENGRYKNSNPFTCHFVNIVAQGFEFINGVATNYYSYYDNGTSSITKGTNTSENRLYQINTNNGTRFEDRTNLNINIRVNGVSVPCKIYIMTEVRPNINTR